MDLPAQNSEWKHTNGNHYTVICIANESTTDSEKYPVTVVYRGDNEKIWSRPLHDWHRSMRTFSPMERLGFYKS
jgi:hypothetical protein